MVEEIMLVSFLHDVGKIIQRAGLKYPRRELGGDFYEHDELSYGFISEYLGEEYAELFKEGRWKFADYASASERIEAPTTGAPSSTPLLDPAYDIASGDELPLNKDVWYPVNYIDFNADPEAYRTVKRGEALINYRGIYDVLTRLAKDARAIKDSGSLLETYDFIYKTVALLVPAAVYQAVPNTSLYGHSRLAAPLSVCKRVRLLVIDVKGIQRFITNVKGEKESSKRLRGRSFFLQMLQRALVDKIADMLGLSSLNNISFEPGKVIFVVCNDVKQQVDELLLKLEEWSNYELQFASALSDEIEVSEIKIFSERGEDRNFKKALDDAFGRLKIVGKPSITQDIGVDVFADVYPENSMVEAKSVNGIDTLTSGEVPEGDISEINLISLIVGHSIRDLKYVVEIIYKDGVEVKNEYQGNNRFGRIYIKPLNIGFILIHGDENLARLRTIVQEEKRFAKRMKVFTVNKTRDFIYPEVLQDFDIISFGYISLSTHHPVDEYERFVSLDDLADYIGLGITDGDKIGEIVRRLSAYPGRFMTFSSLLEFAFAHIVTAKVAEEGENVGESENKVSKDGKKPVVVLYSGGDDLAVYGRWDEVLVLLEKLSVLVQGILPSVTVSGGLFIFKKKYPIGIAYSKAREFEGVAKRERVKGFGRVASNIFEGYVEDGSVSNIFENCVKDQINEEGMKSFSWEDAEKFLEYAKGLIQSGVPSAYLYKLYSIGEMIEECEVPRALVTYAYLNARNKDTFKKVREITENYLADYPQEDEKKAITGLLKFRTVVNMYSLLNRS
ncbi:hydrolase [Candidatus Marsarchaeota G2 archaeon ECH_B_SAG-C16]|uniref:Hydrolase n=1 Tax=Candidatus Marsarchaeota G2 archaeon ECH_B_SAG-C16 TaxID=1978163 RepID=A0A2R6B8N1_9ARCH|nr:MAG: hydrolase [Candidatus Marsarchaeota G2 archaeon ECH_B_SAG-C16]